MDQKELNVKQRRWMERYKDHDYTIEYHLGKDNVIAGALSRKTQGNATKPATQNNWGNDGVKRNEGSTEMG